MITAYIYDSHFSVNCQWGSWGSWHSCSKSCGWGTQTRYRYKSVYAQYGGNECYGSSSETQSCKIKSCWSGSSGSCLIGSTHILMENYTSKPITEVKHGDMILDGNLNPVLVHSVITNYLYDRKLYTFKDGPVFTEDHLFYSNMETEELGNIEILSFHSSLRFNSCQLLSYKFLGNAGIPVTACPKICWKFNNKNAVT